MASQLFAFIATKTTYSSVVPRSAVTQAEFNRKITNAFAGNTGRPVHIGEIIFFPLASPDSARSLQMPNVILCDGSEVPKLSFPELAEYLGNTQGTPVDAANFVLPDVRSFIFAPTVPVQVVDTGGTVTTGQETIVPTESGETGATQGTYVVSGGRPRTLSENEREE